jgi:hypothetical protein
MLLIGSKAIKHHFSDFPRDPKDEDYAVTSNQHKNSIECEYLYNPVLGDLSGIADPNILYTLKISHLVGWDINWDKHMFDVQFLNKKGCVLDIDLFYRLYNHWNIVHSPNKRSDLDMSAEDFFDNALNTPHDYYHTLINPVPIYTKILKDGAEVEVCEEKFNNLSFQDKLDLVREEVMIMAYERYKNKDYRHAYSKMLKKFIINHAPIWEAIFIIENFISLHKPLFNYYKKIEDGLQKTK